MQIMHRGVLRQGTVCEFDHRRASHTVEWAESTAIKVQRTARGSRQEETTTVVNFARDQVLKCVPNIRE